MVMVLAAGAPLVPTDEQVCDFGGAIAFCDMCDRRMPGANPSQSFLLCDTCDIRFQFSMPASVYAFAGDEPELECPCGDI